MKKNNLDERQEQILLKIEHNGCYIAFWGLLIAILAEAFIFNFDFRTIAGEGLVFMVLSIYLFVASVKNGIWDRRFKPNFKTNLIISAVAAVIIGILVAVSAGMRDPGEPLTCIIAGVFAAGFVFVLCIVLLSLSSKEVKKIAAKQETEEAEE